MLLPPRIEHAITVAIYTNVSPSIQEGQWRAFHLAIIGCKEQEAVAVRSVNVPLAFPLGSLPRLVCITSGSSGIEYEGIQAKRSAV
jgi:hypothetical protein